MEHSQQYLIPLKRLIRLPSLQQTLTSPHCFFGNIPGHVVFYDTLVWGVFSGFNEIYGNGLSWIFS